MFPSDEFREMLAVSPPLTATETPVVVTTQLLERRADVTRPSPGYSSADGVEASGSCAPADSASAKLTARNETVLECSVRAGLNLGSETFFTRVTPREKQRTP